MSSMAIPVCSHLAWRFREWYRHPKLLSMVACPPLKDILQDMVRATSNTNLGTDDRRPFVLYSCHDVTLLAFLYAIGADFLVAGDDCGGMAEEGETYKGMVNGSIRNGIKQSSWRWWPAYSSTIAFELVQLDESLETGEQYVIRVILNGETLRLIPRMKIDDEALLSEQPVSSRQVFGERTPGGKSKMMGLSDFEQLIRVLEKVGEDCSTEEVSTSTTGTDKIGVDAG